MVGRRNMVQCTQSNRRIIDLLQILSKWSLITRMEGYTTGWEVLPLQKGGLEKVLAMLKEGGSKMFGVVFHVHPLKRGCE